MARVFKALHDGPGLFVIPNPWDGASAKILAAQGCKALTTTSAGLAFVLGKPDGGVTREQSLWNAKLIVDSIDIPVAADLENGFGHNPEDAAETIRRAAAIDRRTGGSRCAARQRWRRTVARRLHGAAEGGRGTAWTRYVRVDRGHPVHGCREQDHDGLTASRLCEAVPRIYHAVLPLPHPSQTPPRCRSQYQAEEWPSGRALIDQSCSRLC